MTESMLIADEDVSPAERDVRSIDQGFLFPKNNAVVIAKRLPPLSLRGATVRTIVDSSESYWTARTFHSVGMGPVAGEHESSGVFHFVSFDFEANMASLSGVNRNHSSEPLTQAPLDSPTPTSAEQRIANLRAWIATHSPLPYEADDSRESIYGEREE